MGISISTWLRGSVSAAAVLGALAPAAVHAQAPAAYSLNIPSQDLGSALRAFGKATGQQLIFDERSVQGKRSPALIGVYSVPAAMHRLLDQNDLSAYRTSGGAMAIAVSDRSGAPAIIPASVSVPASDAGKDSAAVAAPPTEAPPPAAGTTVLQDIVVTATRRSSSLQKVPGTVEAVPSTTLKKLNITSVLQLTDVVPGLVVLPSGGNNLYLRGVGSASTGYNEAQVAVYIDGLYLANPAMSVYSFNNIEQIEVLKGPQGTLYGRNATAGLISVTTRDPGSTQRLDASVGYGNYKTWTGNIYASTPITDNLWANVAVFSSDQSQGWSRNLFDGSQIQRGKETGVETKLLWKPTDKTKVTASFIYDFNNRDYGYAYQVAPGTIGSDGSTYHGKYKVDFPIDPSSPFHSYIGSLKIEQDLGFAKLTSTTGYQTSQEETIFPGGSPNQGTTVATTVDPFFETNRTWSQEFQLTSAPSSSRLDWVAGFFYYSDRDELALSDYQVCTACTLSPPPSPNTKTAVPETITGYPTTLSYSGYGDVNYRFFDATHLTVGLRYTDETKGLTGSTVALPGYGNSGPLPTNTVASPGAPYTGTVNGVTGLQPGIPAKLHFDKLTYRVVLAQDFGRDIHAYLSDNLGFKSGAYNANLFTNPPVKPEVLDAYEAGLKSELFDRRLRFNAAAFYYNYTNVQVRSTVGAPVGNAFLENVASEHDKGVDVDFSVAVTKNFTINGGAEYLDARYVNYPGTTCTTPKVVNGVVVAGLTVTANCNLKGLPVMDAPPVTASIGATYQIPTEIGLWTFTANDHANSRYSLWTDNSIIQHAHNVVDLNATWASLDKHYDVQFYVRNLTDQYVYATAQVTGSDAVVPGAPRTFGVTIGYHY